MATIIPDRLTPVPSIDRTLLPAWVTDVGIMEPDDDNPRGVFVMVARNDQNFFHCDCDLSTVTFDSSFWQRIAAPMVHNLGGTLFEAEWPGMTGQSIRWEVEADMGWRKLAALEQTIIDRRKELMSWKAPVPTD